MIMNKEERTLEEQDKATTSQSTHLFWDRPVPRPQYDWPHAPRMPDEWNAVVASMRIYEGNHIRLKGEQYQDTFSDEISEPLEFMDRQPSLLDHVRKQNSIQLQPQKTDSEQDFKTLHTRFHKPKKPPDPYKE